MLTKLLLLELFRMFIATGMIEKTGADNFECISMISAFVYFMYATPEHHFYVKSRYGFKHPLNYD